MTNGPSGVSATPIEAARVDSRHHRLLDRAIILHSQPYRETSLLVDVFTEHHGRLRLLAKGARRGKPPRAAMLHALHCVRLSFTGCDDLPLLTAAEPEDSEATPMLAGAALYCGFYLAELLTRLLPTHDPHPHVFSLTLSTLRQLATGEGLQPLLRGFEVALLDELGYGLRLDGDADGRAIEPNGSYVYQLEQGPVASKSAAPGAVRGGTLLALAGRQFTDVAQLKEAKRLMRGILHHYLNGRPLKSRELFQPMAHSPAHER